MNTQPNLERQYCVGLNDQQLTAENFDRVNSLLPQEAVNQHQSFYLLATLTEEERIKYNDMEVAGNSMAFLDTLIDDIKRGVRHINVYTQPVVGM